MSDSLKTSTTQTKLVVMNIKQLTQPIGKIVTQPQFIGPAVFLGVGAGKTIKDYKKAPPEEKAKVLLRDTSILTGSALAVSLATPMTNKFCNAHFFKLFAKGLKNFISIITKKPIKTSKAIKSTEKIIDRTEYVLKSAIGGTTITLAGILGAVSASAFMEKFVFSKFPFNQFNKQQESTNAQQQETETTLFEEEQETNNDSLIEIEEAEQEKQKKNKFYNFIDNGYFKESSVFKNFDYSNIIAAKDTANRVISTVSDIPEMKILSKPLVALTGFSVANTEGSKNKVKKTCYELLSNTMIPTLFVSATSVLLNEQKNKVKYPAILASLLLGGFAGKKTADYYKEKMDSQIDKIHMHKFFM